MYNFKRFNVDEDVYQAQRKVTRLGKKVGFNHVVFRCCVGVIKRAQRGRRRNMKSRRR
jgi:hypothetical protein